LSHHAPSFHVGRGVLKHLGLVFTSDADVKEIAQRATASGGLVQKQGTRETAGISEAFAYVRDPDGYVIELSTRAILYAQCIDGSCQGD
jgi:catechol 2,3-dioxygenase-like lactoylglutathione lyase family enzyme